MKVVLVDEAVTRRKKETDRLSFELQLSNTKLVSWSSRCLFIPEEGGSDRQRMNCT